VISAYCLCPVSDTTIASLLLSCHLRAQEVDPTPDTSDFEQMEWAQDSFFTELASSIPGIDEAMSFAEVLKQVRYKQEGGCHTSAVSTLGQEEEDAVFCTLGTRTVAQQRSRAL
jgi:hypothetical protein